MKQITGRFYFKKTNNDNLVGEFSNYNELKVFSESADKIRKTNDFTGNYNSSWQENRNSLFAPGCVYWRRYQRP